ncbi:MAG: hypothetical protein R3F20_15995 [Planctomycetota bacterium]
MNLETGAVTSTTIDFSAGLAGEFQWVSGASPDRSGRVVIAARRTTTLLADLLRLDLATGSVDVVDVRLRPNVLVSFWPHEDDLDRPFLHFDASIYSADFLSGELTLIAR